MEQPFLTYTSNRPCRIAFIVDIDEKSIFDTLGRIIDYASRKWGGRFYQIIPSKNGAVGKSWVKYIAAYDPDIICAMANLSKTTIKQIASASNPYSFTMINKNSTIHFPDDPADVLPSPQNTMSLWRYDPINNPRILELGYENNATLRAFPRCLRRFIDFNFGKLPSNTQISSLISEYRYEKIFVKNQREFKDAMAQVIGAYTRRIDPIAFSCIPGIHYCHVRENDAFNVKIFVGDSPLDIIYYWNEKLLSPNWLSSRKTEVWIPKTLFEDDSLLASILPWLSKIADFDNGHTHKLCLVSTSINKNTLNKYSRKLTSNRFSVNGQFATICTDRISSPEIPRYSNRVSATSLMKTSSVSGDTFTIQVDEIDQLEGGMGGQVWMTDVFIRREDEDSRVTPRKEFWLQFPRNNTLAGLCVCHNASHNPAGRITRLGMLSIAIARKNQFNGEDYLLNVTIPSYDEIAERLLCSETNTWVYSNDARKALPRARQFGRAATSRAGRSLQGFVHLFNGLMESAHLFSNPYWRRVFYAIAGEDPLGSNKKSQDLDAWVARYRTDPRCSDESFSEKMKEYAVQLNLDSKTQPFDYFGSELKKEFEEYNSLSPGEKKRYDRCSRQGLLNELSWLIDIGALRAGYVNKCAHCGLSAWHSLDSISNVGNECYGCGYTFSVQPERPLHYKISSVFGQRAIYNQIPVSLALAALHDKATSSFYYVPAKNVYMDRKHNPFTDIDIFAIVDGSLIIGEVKNSQDGFKLKDFDNLYEVARRLKPTKVVVTASMDEYPNQTNTARIDALAKRLKRIGVKVEWLSLNGLGFRNVFRIDPTGIWGHIR